jgi:hypothetical protein
MIDAYKSLLNQTESELKFMKVLLTQTQVRKRNLRNFLCGKFSPSWKESIHKLRNIVNICAPPRLNEMIMKTLHDPQNAVTEKIKKITPSINSYRGSTMVASAMQIEDKVRNFYDEEIKNMTESTLGSNANNQLVAKQLLQADFTGYGHNKRNMILYVNFKYDFPVANPITLLSARWNFVLKEQQIVQFVERRMKCSKEESKKKFIDYKEKYNQWRYKNRKLDAQASGTSSEQKQQRRVDIYGRDAHFTSSPKIPMLTGGVVDMDDLMGNSIAMQFRKESIELDVEGCK